MPNYQNGKIYKLTSRETSKIYIGSTTQQLRDRLYRHRNYLKDITCTCSSTEITIHPDATITLIENYPCNNRKELEIREGIIQRQFLDIIVNKKIAGETESKEIKDAKQKKYREDHKEYNRQYKKQYQVDNKERLNKECRERHHANKDDRNAISRKYYEDHKEELNKKRMDKYNANKDANNAIRRYQSTDFGRMCRLFSSFK